MPAHFLLTAAARTLSLASVARMSDEEAERVFVRLRFSANNGDAYCPHCGCLTVYACRRPNGAPRWRCKACRKDFSVTSGTLFAFHKLPLRAYLMAAAIFANEVQGKSMLALSLGRGPPTNLNDLLGGIAIASRRIGPTGIMIECASARLL